MYLFSSFTGDRMVELSSPELIVSASGYTDDLGELSLTVELASFTFSCVVHADDTVTKPSSASSVNITVVR